MRKISSKEVGFLMVALSALSAHTLKACSCLLACPSSLGG